MSDYAFVDPAIVATDASEVSLASVDYDATALPQGYIRAIYVGGAGDVKVTFRGGGVVTYKAKPQGSYVFGCITKIWKTGTSATLLIAEQ